MNLSYQSTTEPVQCAVYTSPSMRANLPLFGSRETLGTSAQERVLRCAILRNALDATHQHWIYPITGIDTYWKQSPQVSLEIEPFYTLGIVPKVV